jgi:GT2 family glycosyltransferase
MVKPIKVIEVELSKPIEDVGGLSDYAALRALVRANGNPIGWVEVPVVDNLCLARTLRAAIVKELTIPIADAMLDATLKQDLLQKPNPATTLDRPAITVAVCTRNRADQLEKCLRSLLCLDYPSYEILVIDNAPNDNSTCALVSTFGQRVDYVRESTPGLDWARNRAIAEAQGEIVAFVDDDVVVDAGWLGALVAVLVKDKTVMAVTGLVVPYELETTAQILFEQYGGFGRGFERQVYRTKPKSGYKLFYQGTGQCGTGANMAFRRILFEKIGGFDPALDVGTVTNGGGDLEMFFRVLKEGYTLVYEPRALVRHRHRRRYAELRTQLTNNGTGLYAYLVRSALAYPSERTALLLLGLWWLWYGNLRRLLISLLRPDYFPRDLILAELRGSLAGLIRYQQARRALPANTGSLGQPIEFESIKKAALL